MQKVLYRSLLKIAREADADPALKQEIIRKSNPLIQAATAGLNRQLLCVDVAFQDLRKEDGTPIEVPVEYRDVIAIDKKGVEDAENIEVKALHPEYGVDIMRGVTVYWDANITAKLKNGEVSLMFKDNDKCTWNASEVKTSVYPCFPLASYISQQNQRLFSESTSTSSSSITTLTDAKEEEKEEFLDVLAIGGYYGSERLPKWYKGKWIKSCPSKMMKPNFFSNQNNNNIDDYYVFGGGVSFTWLVRCFFRRKLGKMFHASFLSAGIDIKEDDQTQTKTKNNIAEMTATEADKTFELFAAVSQAHSSAYGHSSYKSDPTANPNWLQYVKTCKQQSTSNPNPTSSSSQRNPNPRLWPKWGSDLKVPDNSSSSSTQLDHHADVCESTEQLRQWNEFETQAALLACNASYLVAFQERDLQTISKIWGFDSTVQDPENNDHNSKKLFPKPTLVHPGWNNAATLQTGFEEIKDYYETNFEARGDSSIDLFIDQIEVQTDGYLRGTITQIIRLEFLPYKKKIIQQIKSDENNNLVRCLVISNQFARNAIGENFIMIHHHASITN